VKLGLSVDIVDDVDNERLSVKEEECLIDFVRAWSWVTAENTKTRLDTIYPEHVFKSLVEKKYISMVERRAEFFYAPTQKGVKRAFQIYDRGPAYVGGGFVPGKVFAHWSPSSSTCKCGGNCNCK